MDYKELEQMILEAKDDPVGIAAKAIEDYFSKRARGKRTVYASTLQKELGKHILSRAEVSQYDFNKAWNKLVGKGLLWQHKLDGKTVYTFGEDEAKGKAEGPINKAKQPPKVISSGSKKTSGASFIIKGGMNFEGAGSPAEGAEEALVYGMNNRKDLTPHLENLSIEPSFMKKLQGVKAMKKVPDTMLITWIKIGVLCGNAGGVKKALRFGAETLTALEGMNATPKTDILIDKLQVSVKDSDAGYQAEAIEANSFAPLFNGAFEIFKKDHSNEKGYEWITELSSDKVNQLMVGILDGYRKGEEVGDHVNALLGLDVGEESRRFGRKRKSSLKRY